MKRLLASTAAAATLVGAGFFAGRGFQAPPEEPAIRDCGAIAEDDSARMLALLARRAVRMNAPGLRSELGAGPGGDASITYWIQVAQDGRMAMVGASSTCRGTRCPGESELPEIIGLLVASEWQLRKTGAPCLIELVVEIPEAVEPPLMRLPARTPGIEL